MISIKKGMYKASSAGTRVVKFLHLMHVSCKSEFQPVSQQPSSVGENANYTGIIVRRQCAPSRYRNFIEDLYHDTYEERQNA